MPTKKRVQHLNRQRRLRSWKRQNGRGSVATQRELARINSQQAGNGWSSERGSTSPREVARSGVAKPTLQDKVHLDDDIRRLEEFGLWYKICDRLVSQDLSTIGDLITKLNSDDPKIKGIGPVLGYDVSVALQKAGAAVHLRQT